MISIRQKIPYLLAITSSFFENCFPPPLIASTNRKIALVKKKTVSTRQKIRFHYPDKGFVAKCVSTIRKCCFHFKNLKISESIEKTGVY